MQKAILCVLLLLISNHSHAEWAVSGMDTVYRGDSPPEPCNAAKARHQNTSVCPYTDTFSGLVTREGFGGLSYYCEFTRTFPACGHYPNGYSHKWRLGAYYNHSYKVSGSEADPSDNCEGNPCDVVTGRKTERVKDHVSKNIAFYRYYDSGSAFPVSRMGVYWKHSFETTLDSNYTLIAGSGMTFPPTPPKYALGSNVASSSYGAASHACTAGWGEIKTRFRRGTLSQYSAYWENDSCEVRGASGKKLASLVVSMDSAVDFAVMPKAHSFYTVSKPDGSLYTFVGGGVAGYREKDGKPVSLAVSGDQVVFTDTNGEKDTFFKGVMVSRTLASGVVLSISRDAAGRIIKISDPYNDAINISYNVANLVSSISHAGVSTNYTYDPLYNLASVTYADGTSVQYHYENVSFPHHLTGYTDQNGIRYATWSYDAEGRAVSSEHAGGAEKVTMDYLADRTIVTDALGAQRTYHLDSRGGQYVVTSVTGDRCKNCNNNDAVSREYDEMGRLTSKTDWEGNVTTFIYNSRGLEIERTEAVGTPLARTIKTTWHATLPKPIQIEELGRFRYFSYDADGRVTSQSIDSQTWQYTYTANDQIESVDGPRTDVLDKTFYVYDLQGNLESATNALGQAKTFSDYNARGEPGLVRDVNGVETRLTFDSSGRMVSSTQINPQGLTDQDATTQYTYDNVGNLVRIVFPEGDEVVYEYDEARRLVAIESASGERMEYELDPLGNRLETRFLDADAQNRFLLSSRYNELGELIKSISPFGEETLFGYDANGNQILRTDATNQSWQSSYDALNRLVAQIDPKAGEAKYQYDALDRLTKVTDQKGLSTDYQYDAFGNKTRQISPDTGTTNYDYDAAGNLTRKTDARGVVSEYQYDALNRLTAVTYPAHPEENVQYQYDLVSESSEGIGRLGRITDLSGVTEYSYDGRGNITSKRSLVEAQSYVVAYRYDRANRLVGLTYPDGRVVRYERDEQGNIQRVQTQVSDTAPWVTLADQVSYLPFGGVSEFTYGNGVTQNFAHDQAYRLTRLATQGLGPVLNRQYQYDVLNNISQISDAVTPANSQSFVYDELSRLIEAEGGYGALGYQYDVVGNRLSQSKTVGSQNLVETYNYAAGSHRLQQVTEQSGSTTRTRTLQYDANGNLIQDQRLDGQQFSLHYNGSNRLSEVDKSSAPLASYLHNALGQRVAKVATDPAQDEHYLYDEQGQLLTVVRRTDNSMSHYVYLDEHRIAMISGLDTTSPSQPLNLTAMSTSPSTAALSWSASTDNVGVTGYRIYRNGVLITTQTGLSYTDTGLAAATYYEYQISAVDAAGNVSALSLMDDITTSAVSVFERRVNNGNDDAEEGTAGNVVLTSSDLELAYDAGMGNQHIGIRFTSVQVPANAVITKAYLQFQARDAGSSATELSIMAINEPNTATFTTTTAYGISNRSRVGSVAWSNPPAWVVGQNYQSPDITSLVQSVVNLSGWNTGNAMGFVLTGTGTRNAYAYNSGATRAPLLHIEYYVPTP